MQQPAHNPESSKLRLVILAGLPHSGKSKVALELRARGWDHIQRHEQSSLPSLLQAMRDSLRAGRDVVIDSADLTRAERTEWISTAQTTTQVSPYCIICAETPPEAEASLGDPGQLQYREQWMSPQATASMTAEQARDRVHEVIKMLDPSFEVPTVAEGIEMLTLVRSPADMENVLGWLSNAVQFTNPASLYRAGWATPAAPAVRGAAEAWDEAHGVASKAAAPAAPQPASQAALPPAPNWNNTSPSAPSWLSGADVQAAQAPTFHPGHGAVTPKTEAQHMPSPPEAAPSMPAANHPGHASSAGVNQGAPSPQYDQQHQSPHYSMHDHLHRAAQPQAQGHLLEQPHSGVPVHQAPLQHDVSQQRPAMPSNGLIVAPGAAQSAAHGNHMAGPCYLKQAQNTGHSGEYGFMGEQRSFALQNGHQGSAEPGYNPHAYNGNTASFNPDAAFSHPTTQQFQPHHQQIAGSVGGSNAAAGTLAMRDASGQPLAVVGRIQPDGTCVILAPGLLPGLGAGARDAFHTPGGPSYSYEHRGGQEDYPADGRYPGPSEGRMGVQRGPGSGCRAGVGGVRGSGGRSATSNDVGSKRGPMSDGRVAHASKRHNAGPEPQSVVRPLQYSTSDPRPILLFEIPGVLCNTTQHRTSSVAKNFLPRPAVRFLLRLMPHFRLGIYTTSTRRTVVTALQIVASAIRGEAASWPDGWRLLLDGKRPAPASEGEDASQEADSSKLIEVPAESLGLPRIGLRRADLSKDLPWASVFDEELILTREHCTLSTSSDGRETTTKAPQKLFPNATKRVLLIDEDRSCGKAQVAAVRCWDNVSRTDRQLEVVVDAVLSNLPKEADADLTAITERVTTACREAVDGPAPVLKPTQSDEGYFEEYPQRVGQTLCDFYATKGYCKFGGDCVKHHPPEYRVKLNTAGFPLRPGKPACEKYLREGFCNLMKGCPKHHPNLEIVPGSGPPPAPASTSSRFKVVNEDWMSDFPQRPEEQPCPEFVESGKCEQGKSCPHHHPLEDGKKLNNYGLPMRPGADDCTYFTQNAKCKFGVKCKHHHPDLEPGPSAAPSSQSGLDLPGFPENSPFVVVDEESGYYAQFAKNPNAQPCPHYVKTGHCKFGMRCQFNHPTESRVKLNMDGLPLRPGAQICRFYVTRGECGYGPQCMLHHPNIAPKDGHFAPPMHGMGRRGGMGAAPRMGAGRGRQSDRGGGYHPEARGMRGRGNRERDAVPHMHHNMGSHGMAAHGGMGMPRAGPQTYPGQQVVMMGVPGNAFMPQGQSGQIVVMQPPSQLHQPAPQAYQGYPPYA